MQPAAALLQWFERYRRDLPWRTAGAAPDPYAVWISEVMLQQTRVETVIPYYQRFLARFPDVAALAGARESEVLVLWSGLGYYRRCRSLLAAAKEVVAAGGELPRCARELERLAGIGPYTAAAIASIAFAEAVAVLDGNVERVAARFAAVAAGAGTRRGRANLLAIAGGLLDQLRPGDSNQALMELGATVCLPRAPRCGQCPLAGSCQARALGAAESFPARAKRVRPRRIRQLVAFVERDGRLLLFRRDSASGRLAGLWEFPSIEVEIGCGPGAAASPEALLAERYGGTWALGEELARLRHAITTSAFAVEVRQAVVGGEGAFGETLGEGAPAGDPGEPGWWARPEVLELPLTGLAKKLLRRPEIQPG